MCFSEMEVLREKTESVCFLYSFFHTILNIQVPNLNILRSVRVLDEDWVSPGSLENVFKLTAWGG